MKRIRSISVLCVALTGVLLASLATPSVARTLPDDVAQAAACTSVGKDAPGDWGANVDPTLAPLGAGLGQDLIDACSDMSKDLKLVNFVIKVSALPPTDGWPEISRYVWSLNVDGKYAELDGKFSNYSRGACDPTAESCPPPRDPGMAPFLVRGDCTTNEANLTTCQEIGKVQATFDAAAATITVPVPCEMLRAKPNSVIAGGSSDFTSVAGGNLVAIPSVFVSSTGFPSDGLAHLGSMTVPANGCPGGSGGGGSGGDTGDGDGGGGGSSTLPGPGVTLRLSNKTPPRGSTVRAKIGLRRCKGHKGTLVQLQRKTGGSYKTIATKKLGRNCIARFRDPANYKRADYRGLWKKQDDDHRSGKSRPQTVTTH